MIVVDASVLAPALADDSADGDLARAALRGDRLIAPELIDLEVITVWRKQVAIGQLVPTRADSARGDLRALPMERISHRDVIERCWALRDNLTPYDAAYVALAEAFDAVLVTADRRLAHAPDLRCRVELLRSSAVGEPDTPHE